MKIPLVLTIGVMPPPVNVKLVAPVKLVVSVAVWPAQMETLFRVAVGLGTTVTVVVATAVQPPGPVAVTV